MNLFLDYQKKIFNSLKKLGRKGLIKIPYEQKERVIADFIAGMTDRYAINLHKKIR